MAAPVAPPAPAPVAASRPAAVTDKRQCPKCSLYETERGSVIGWYCKVCGWREGRGR
jgi:ribosomal protein L37AE/L43A